MTGTPGCRSALAAIQRAVTGAPVTEDEIERALAHLAACEDCGGRVDLGATAACDESEEDLPAAARLVREGEDLTRKLPDLARHLESCERCRAILAELAMEPGETDVPDLEVAPDAVERALAAALDRPDPVLRRRAAERLGSMERLGAEPLSALADAAATDEDAKVRAAALEALDKLDDAVSIPRRVIEAWAEEPGEAAPFIAGVLARLAGTSESVTGLAGSPGEEGVALTGEEGIAGQVAREEGGLWLTLDGLPSMFEKKLPVVAVPVALREDAPPIRWSGERPGLVPSEAPVSEGRLRVRLGETGDAPSDETFERVYLLDPDA